MATKAKSTKKKVRPTMDEDEVPAVAKRKTRPATAPKKAVAANKKAVSPKKTATRTPPPGVPAPVIWEAPADFQPHFLEVEATTAQDGMFTNQIEATRYIGRYDPEAPDNKKRNMRDYDLETMIGIQARLALVTFHPTGRLNKAGISPRLIPNTTYRIVFRIGLRKADNALTAGIRQISRLKKVKSAKTGKVRVREEQLEKTDPDFRKLRKVVKFLPAAFINVLQPPKPTRGGRRQLEEDDE